MDNQDEVFRYTYSAKEQAEVENIRKKYLPKEEDKMEQLRKLDRLPYQKAQSWSIGIGVIGALILGTGMSICMTDVGSYIAWSSMLVGILIGIVGLVLVALAYPMYKHILHRERERIAPEIIRLSDELLK